MLTKAALSSWQKNIFIKEIKSKLTDFNMKSELNRFSPHTEYLIPTFPFVL